MRCKLRLHYARLIADGIVDLHNKFASRKRHPSVGCGAEAHSFGELKLILSKFGGAQQSANKFAFAFICTNFPVVATNAPPRWHRHFYKKRASVTEALFFLLYAVNPAQ